MWGALKITCLFQSWKSIIQHEPNAREYLGFDGANLQLHGGNGYTIERYWRDARLTTIFDGTSEIQRRIIGVRM